MQLVVLRRLAQGDSLDVAADAAGTTKGMVYWQMRCDGAFDAEVRQARRAAQNREYEWGWLEAAVCKDHEYREWWLSDREIDQERAIQVCQVCPVRVDCLEHALAVPEVGVWGAKTEEQRRLMRRQRNKRGGLRGALKHEVFAGW